MTRKIKNRKPLTQRITSAWQDSTPKGDLPKQNTRGGGQGPTFNLGEWQGTSWDTCALWPFVNGSIAPITGAQLGVRYMTREPVGFDPLSWFDENMLTNPQVFVLSNPAVGKSTLLRKMMIGVIACGTNVQVLGDRKNEHTLLIRKLGGQVIQLGPGRGKINILDPGASLAACERILNECEDAELAHEQIDALMGDMHATRVQMLSGLIGIFRRARVSGHEETILGSILRWLHENEEGTPILSDVLRVLREKPQAVRDAANDHGSDDEYKLIIRPLENDLVGLTTPGGLGEMFNGQTTEEVKLDRSVCFDVSSIDENEKDTLSAAYIACWAAGFAATRVSRALTDAGLQGNRRYFVVLDEFWQPLAASPGMVDRVNAITRLGRDKGVAMAYASHTMSDLATLPDEHDRAKAKGIVERCGAVLIGGLSRDELENRVRPVAHLSPAEIELLVSWNVPPSNGDKGRRRDMPGRGNFLIKRGDKLGIPISVVLTQTEIDLGLHDTNKRIRKEEVKR